MGFLAPWFFAGALALGVPIFLHLLRRHTSTPQSFSSLMFFEPRTQSTIRHRRLRYLLLLALRLAVLALLVLAFANPFVNRPAASVSSNRLLIVVLDNSFSMRAGTRLAEAKRAALAVLSSRPPAERAQVMTFGSHLHVLTQPTVDSRALAAAVEGIQAGDSHGNFGELATSIRSFSQGVSGPISLQLFSDMQKSDMPATFADLTLPSAVSLVLHPVVKNAVPNWTVESVNAPSQVWDPKAAVVQAVVAGYDTPAAKRTVSLVVNGKTLQTRTVQVPANGRASVAFNTLNVSYGFSRCDVRIDSADALPSDDAFDFAVERSDPKPILFVHQAADRRSPLYFGSALTASAQSAFTMRSVSEGEAANVDPAKYAFVVLSDLPSLSASFENGLLHYVRNGGGVLIAAGPSTAQSSSIPVFGGKILGTHNYAGDGDRFLTVGDVDQSNPSIAKADGWAGVKFYYAVDVDDAGSRVVARLTDQTPLLLEKNVGLGRILLFASGLSNLSNDFPLDPDFVPFVQQTAYFLAGLQSRGGSRVVGSFLQLRTPQERGVGIELTDPAGHQPLSLQQSTTALSYQLSDTGFYQLSLADGHQNMIGVNADRLESNLAIIPADTLSLWAGEPTGTLTGSPAASPQGQASQKYIPRSLWWYVMLVLLLAVLVETWVANLHLGVRREDP